MSNDCVTQGEGWSFHWIIKRSLWSHLFPQSVIFLSRARKTGWCFWKSRLSENQKKRKKSRLDGSKNMKTTKYSITVKVHVYLFADCYKRISSCEATEVRWNIRRLQHFSQDTSNNSSSDFFLNITRTRHRPFLHHYITVRFSLSQDIHFLF